MALSLNDQFALASNGVFINKIRGAMATITMEELVRDYVTDGLGYEEAEQRISLARSFARDPQGVARRAAVLLATVPSNSDPEATADSAYVNFVRSNWSALAGYNGDMPEAPSASE